MMGHFLIATSQGFFAPVGAQNDIRPCVIPRSAATRNPYDGAIEFAASQGFSPFGYDTVAYALLRLRMTFQRCRGGVTPPLPFLLMPS
jgi:hypothetical protein